uniref:AIG1-type G domain-containing protein n=1 Tax=Knipowitschia caucasica TaxID=637954 RepID=A0AAV2KK75_KNICA
MEGKDRRIVILGKEGSGKSSLANTIFGVQNVFPVCRVLATDPRSTEHNPQLLQIIQECSPGPHAFLLVLKMERFTKQEQAMVDLILKYFSEEALKYTTVVFTHGDELPEDMEIKEWIRENKALNTLVQKCGGRCHVFDNKRWNNDQDQFRNNQHQVQELLRTIDQTVAKNGGKCYTNEMLTMIDDQIQLEVKNMSRQSNLTLADILAKAKQVVYSKLMENMGGALAGVLVGAFLGAGVMVALVLMCSPGCKCTVLLMEDHPVFFLCPELLPQQERSVESYPRLYNMQTSPTVRAPASPNDSAPDSPSILLRNVSPMPPSPNLNTRRVILMGKSGSGKSSLANTIFRAPVFQVNHSSDAKATFSEAQTRYLNGWNLTLIDTPGIFNADRSKDEVARDIFSCLTQSAPGPHAVLIVLLIEKFTEQEQAIIDHIQLHFGEEIFKFATVVFTRGDQLPEGMEKTEYVNQNIGLSNLVQKCGNRCHVVDNKYWKDTNENEYRSNMFQLKAILNSIEDTFNSNNKACFINIAFREVEKNIQKEQDRIHKSEVVVVVQDAVAPVKSTFDYIIETIEAAFKGGRWGLSNTTQSM